MRGDNEDSTNSSYLFIHRCIGMYVCFEGLLKGRRLLRLSTRSYGHRHLSFFWHAPKREQYSNTDVGKSTVISRRTSHAGHTRAAHHVPVLLKRSDTSHTVRCINAQTAEIPTRPTPPCPPSRAPAPLPTIGLGRNWSAPPNSRPTSHARWTPPASTGPSSRSGSRIALPPSWGGWRTRSFRAWR